MAKNWRYALSPTVLDPSPAFGSRAEATDEATKLVNKIQADPGGYRITKVVLERRVPGGWQKVETLYPAEG